MHRIDTANARPDQNGIGKAGFNDNTDLSGQDATYLDPDWCNGVQEEIAAVVEEHEALEKGNNTQLRDALYAIFSTKTDTQDADNLLSAATQEVDDRLSAAIVALGVAMQQAIIDERTAERNRIWPVGKGRHTTYDGLNPADASHLGFGTWILDDAAAGRVEVGAGEITIDYSAATGDAARDDVVVTFTHGDTGGEIDHKQTEEEIAEHTVTIPFGARGGFWETGGALHPRGTPTTGDTTIESETVGGSVPMPVMQPYRVVSVWVRTA